MKRRTFLTSTAAVAVVGMGAGAQLLTNPVGGAAEAGAQTSPETGRTTAPVERGDLATEREFRATVSFGDTWTLTTDLEGTITQAHALGTIVGFGETLLRVDDRPLYLGKGSMPMFRRLEKLDTRLRDENGDRLQLLNGFDVAQLQYFLLEAGHGADGELEVDATFGSSTEKAVKGWQKAVGLSESGAVGNGELVFAADPVRVATTTRVGDRFESLDVNNALPAVLVDTSNRDRSAFTVGGPVAIELADQTSLAGRVDKQEQVTAADGSTVWRTTISTNDALPGDASTATVTVLTVVADDVLHVPVGALLALAEGGFAVELDQGPTTKLVGVDVGEVLDGRAEIEGSVEEGATVVVAR